MSSVVTGAYGFIGRNLVEYLKRKGTSVLSLGSQSSKDEWRESLAYVDIVYHLAGVNRPPTVAEFEPGNVGPVLTLCSTLQDLSRSPKIVMTSSIQAAWDTPYGRSKLHAEEVLLAHFPTARISRLRNVFGRWCRPNYNGVVATFCHNISHGLTIQVSNPKHVLELVHVDDVTAALVDPRMGIPFTSVTLGELADRIKSFHAGRGMTGERFNDLLYETYRSYAAN